MPVVLAILGALSYGAGDFLGGMATKRIRESLGVVAVSSGVMRSWRPSARPSRP